ncbi:DUF3108 domain-containing protein [bacterium]|nr:DUF3108 domain-containing protein [bacterium]
MKCGVSTFGMIIVLILFSSGAIPVSGDSGKTNKSKQKNTEVLLINSMKPDLDNGEPLQMFMEEDPLFIWNELDKSKENPIFKEGEMLKYKVTWMGISAGTVTMNLEVDSILDGQPVFKVVVVGKTNKTFSFFFKVNDVITSFIDTETFNSQKYIKDVREGHYRKFKETHYNQIGNTARVRDNEYEIPPNSKDPIACIYALRRYPATIGKTIRMNSNSEGKNNYPVKIGFSEKAEIKLDDDIKRSVIIGKPLPTWDGRVFEKKQSEVVLWFSDDEYFVPLRLESKVRIGTMKAELIQRQGPGWEVNFEKD